MLGERLVKFSGPQLSEVELVKFQMVDVCHLCKKTFTAICIKVRDHCHVTGKCTCNVEELLIKAAISKLAHP